MKRTQITLKGWANNSTMLFSENSRNDKFMAAFCKLKAELESKGYTELSAFDDLRDKKAQHKITVKAHYWRGAWADPTTETYAIFYK